jgi:formyl-CoA transferase
MKPLEGTIILELCSSLAGAFGTQLLAGLGAEVILVEPPSGGIKDRSSPPYAHRDGISMEKSDGWEETGIPFLKRARCKKSITLDMESAEGRGLFLRLASYVDAVVDSSPPAREGSPEIGYPELSAVNPSLIYCTVRPFGGFGPLQSLPGTDLTLQAMSGAMLGSGLVHAVESEEGAFRCGVAVSRLIASLNVAIGLLAALERRETSDKGQWIDVSMHDSLVAMKAMLLPESDSGAIRAPFGIFRARDGDIVICASTEKQWEDMARVMGMEELAQDPRFKGMGARCANVAELNAIILEWLEDKNRNKALRILSEGGVPCSPIMGVSELLEDEHLHHRRMVTDLLFPSGREVRGSKGYGMPIKFSDSPVGLDSPPPALGQHNREVFISLLGISEGEMEWLQRGNII